MPKRQIDRSLGVAAYFAPDAHATAIKRVIAAFIDLVVSIVLLVLVGLVSSIVLIFDPTADPSALMFLLWAFASWLYFTKIKASKWRTIGYRATGLKVVNKDGDVPSTVTMTFRTMLLLSLIHI